MKRKGLALILVIALLVGIVLLPACSKEEELIVENKGGEEVAIGITQTPSYEPYKQEGEVYYNGEKIGKVKWSDNAGIIVEPLILKDNEQAEKVSSQKLFRFLRQTRSIRDDMYSHHLTTNVWERSGYYVEEMPDEAEEFFLTSGYYAEEIHNDAEINGIKAGIALLDIGEEGNYGIAVFYTTDKGLIYIDGCGEFDETYTTETIGEICRDFAGEPTIKSITTFWEGYKENSHSEEVEQQH